MAARLGGATGGKYWKLEGRGIPQNHAEQIMRAIGRTNFPLHSYDSVPMILI